MTSAGPLPRRRLGRTGLDVTVLGFGAMELRGAAHRRPRPIDAADADAVLGAVLDAGINLIDTSIDYGESEASIGRALAHRRHEFVLATKAGCPLDPAAGAPADGPLPHDYRREHIVAGLEQSLRRLRTDHVDVLQLHSNVAAAARGPLDDELVAEVDRRLAAAGVVSARTAAPTG